MTAEETFKINNSIEDDELDKNLILFIKYTSSKKDFEFTPTSIIHDTKLKTTALRFGRLMNANEELLKNEEVVFEKVRKGYKRNYHYIYEEPILENDE